MGEQKHKKAHTCVCNCLAAMLAGLQAEVRVKRILSMANCQ